MTFQNMKTFLTMVLVLSSSVLLFANDNQLSNVTVKAHYGRKLVVSIEDMHFDATLRLYQADGGLLTKVKASAPEFARMFDLSQLQAGTYSLVVEYGIREMSMPVIIENHQAVLEVGPRTITMKPIVRKANEQEVDLTVHNDQISTILVEIVDRNGRVVYQDKLEHVLRVEKRYDLSKLLPDTYSFVVMTPQKTYTTEVKNW